MRGTIAPHCHCLLDSPKRGRVMPTSTESLTPSRFGEILPFAKKHGVDAYLYSVEKMTRRVFPDAARISLFIEDDPEIANDAHLVFEVFVSGNFRIVFDE